MISKINRETRSRFSDTFEQISKNFSSVFKELFGDQGRASLVMLDESDPLESGIDIIAKPPGKKPQSITLLSVGPDILPPANTDLVGELTPVTFLLPCVKFPKSVAFPAVAMVTKSIVSTNDGDVPPPNKPRV